MPIIQTSYLNLHRKITSRLEKRWERMARRSSAAQQQQREGDRGGNEAAPDAGAQVAAAPQRQEAQPNNNNNNGNANPPPAAAAGAAGQVRNRVEEWVDGNGSALLNFLAGSLLMPGVWCGMGELMRLLLPRRLVTRPSGGGAVSSAPLGSATGLLQERWGRSLVGGCLFVVIRDAFALYLKYRRAVGRSHRRIRNVPEGERRTRK